jgi:hypothetical protein
LSSQYFLIHAAGVVLFIIAAANLWVPAKLNYAENLARVSPIVRQVFIIHSLFIVLVVVASGALCLFLAPRLVAVDPLSSALSGFLALFWALRFAIQILYVDSKFLRGHLAGHISYSFASAFLAVVFLGTLWQSLS